MDVRTIDCEVLRSFVKERVVVCRTPASGVQQKVALTTQMATKEKSCRIAERRCPDAADGKTTKRDAMAIRAVR